MPAYTYYDEETGLRIDVRRKVDDRNKPIVLRRFKSIPDRVGVLVPGATPEWDFNKRVLKGYHKLEERDGSRFRSEHSKKKISRVWGNN